MRAYVRTANFTLLDAEDEGLNALNFTGADGATRAQIVATYNGESGSLRMGVAADSDSFLTVMRVESDGAVRLPLVYTEQTTAGDSNLVVLPNGTLARSTSSERRKRDFQPLTKGLAEVLQIEPVTYRSRSDLDGDTVFPGLKAEQLHEIGLEEFVVYDDDGRPDAIRYPQLAALFVAAFREQTAQIDALTQRVAALE